MPHHLPVPHLVWTARRRGGVTYRVSMAMWFSTEGTLLELRGDVRNAKEAT